MVIGQSDSKQVLDSFSFLNHLSRGGRSFSRTAWLLWPFRHILELFRQTRREGFRRRILCSSFPARLREQTPVREEVERDNVKMQQFGGFTV